MLMKKNLTSHLCKLEVFCCKKSLIFFKYIRDLHVKYEVFVFVVVVAIDVIYFSFIAGCLFYFFNYFLFAYKYTYIRVRIYVHGICVYLTGHYKLSF